MNQRETLRFMLTGDPEGGGWTDSFLDSLIAARGFYGALLMLAEAEIRRLEEEPSQISEEGGLTLKYENRTKSLREIADRCRRSGSDEDGPCVLVGESEAWRDD